MNWRVQFQRALVGWIQAPSLVMVVKRFKQMNNWGKEEFQEHMSKLGRLRHLNMLPLVAYYYRKEEKLLAFDYVQKASLAVHLHGSKSSSSKQKKKSSSAKKKNSADTQDSASSSKKKSPFDQLKKKDLLQLLKKSIEDNSDSEGSPKESEASSDSDPLMVAYFGHDSEG
ncbi:hypothetical protein I3842_15G141600 [Carya illinoinensis]|uniref:Serine-threonine/tyrosine-protein kinase catalytic domain-containing protein n=1 Tax=Carya illinoinensis TaxID=32201 RepID=A0A922AC70_CARIL|nr:hypothetical protein I3842_15G141600 [Carya illinoinensis]